MPSACWSCRPLPLATLARTLAFVLSRTGGNELRFQLQPSASARTRTATRDENVLVFVVGACTGLQIG
ncbi:MAG TPA: hypothetical protein VFX59_31825 [Polyangiales bacterium]|nr:hypothetical protein [Polyangiales bacterium]